jgi:hypothetical protein
MPNPDRESRDGDAASESRTPRRRCCIRIEKATPATPHPIEIRAPAMPHPNRELRTGDAASESRTAPGMPHLVVSGENLMSA